MIELNVADGTLTLLLFPLLLHRSDHYLFFSFFGQIGQIITDLPVPLFSKISLFRLFILFIIYIHHILFHFIVETWIVLRKCGMSITEEPISVVAKINTDSSRRTYDGTVTAGGIKDQLELGVRASLLI